MPFGSPVAMKRTAPHRQLPSNCSSVPLIIRSSARPRVRSRDNTSLNARQYIPTALLEKVASIRFLCGFGLYRVMIIPDFLDLAVDDLHHFRPDRFHSSVAFARSGKERLGDALASVSSTGPQVAVTIGEHCELALVRFTNRGATFASIAVGSNEDWFVMVARHYAPDVMPVERIEVTLDQLLFTSHPSLPPC